MLRVLAYGIYVRPHSRRFHERNNSESISSTKSADSERTLDERMRELLPALEKHELEVAEPALSTGRSHLHTPQSCSSTLRPFLSFCAMSADLRGR